jgi:hypothetical protein
MRPRHHFQSITFVALLALMLLSACTSPTPTPIPPTPTTPPTIASSPTIEPSPAVPTSAPVTPSPEATRRPAATYRPRPTATLYKADEAAEPGVFTNNDLGVSLRYPNRWITAPPDQGSDILTYFLSPDGAITALLFSGPMGDTQSLQAVAAEIRGGLTQSLTNVKTVSDEASTLDDGHSAWSTVLTAKRNDGSQLKVNVTVVSSGGRAFALVAFGNPDDFDSNVDDINQLIGALHLERPKLFGLGRDQAFVLSGGESTNPREYDPATTHGSGDKLVFSGLYRSIRN